ncbi:MAG TPA: PaaI family thioesterase [Gemmatimonadaceae bacterium]|nr:PaaI family thioesterase [Gemmatimonadaceae bacterium]
MATLGARLERVAPGEVVIGLPFDAALTQQHGFLHAGAVTAAVDSACGYAALTLMAPKAGVLSVEFKVNLLAPAAAEHFRAVGRVLRAGRTLSICTGELRAVQPGGEIVVAVMQATMMTVRDRPALAD